MRIVVVTPPAPVVTWEEADAHLKLDGDTTQQDEVEAMIAAATAVIDGPTGWLGRAIGVQTLEARFDKLYPDCGVYLPYAPVNALVSVKYLDADDVEQTADLADFDLFGSELYPRKGRWAWAGGSSRREAVRVRYEAGYATIPAPIRAAILLMVGDLYRFRDSVAMGGTGGAVEVPMTTTVSNLLWPFRVWA